MQQNILLSFTDMDSEKLGRISRSLYAMLNSSIGPEVSINIRRTSTNLGDDISRIHGEIEDWEKILVYSGSKAEGLRFDSSDDDWMWIYRTIKVIPSDSYMAIYDSNTTLLLMDNEMTKPGFTLLKLIGEYPMAYMAVRGLTEHILNGLYLSCKKWREFHTSQSQFTHGPCASAVMGPCEYDLAFCLRCDIWPANAHDCIRRLHLSAWPSHDTVLKIVNDGVLFVPIGAKQSIFENTEWRMSFSLAEKKLIHAMNHTQFLCYGLLKIFLKEAIDSNPDVKGLLCSYFLKTALFWEITTTSNQWNPSTLLSCFWNCFCRLLQWVSCSYCPNFFIPQNNMFGGKIEGRNRDKLLQHLRILYHEGYRCLLRCQSLENSISYIIHRYAELFAEEIDNKCIACEIINESDRGPAPDHFSIKSILTYQLAYPTTSHQRFLLKTWLHQCLINFSLTGTNYLSPETPCNKSNYRNLTKRMNIMGRCRTDSVSYFLYQAMLCYNNERYTQALRLVQRSKEKISHPRSMYWMKQTRKQYEEAGLDRLPIETVLRRHFLDDIRIKSDQYIPELYLEMHSPDADSTLKFVIPPLVCSYFLQCLCCRKLGHVREAEDALYELSLLVQQDDDHHISLEHRAISWHIVGICQQMRGDDQEAFQSYFRAQQQLGGDLFKVAASIRLGTMLLKYFNNFWQFKWISKDTHLVSRQIYLTGYE